MHYRPGHTNHTQSLLAGGLSTPTPGTPGFLGKKGWPTASWAMKRLRVQWEGRLGCAEKGIEAGWVRQPWPPTCAQAAPLAVRNQQEDYLGYRYCRSCRAPHCASSGGLPCMPPVSTSHTPGRAPCLHDRPGGSAAGLGWQKKHCRSEGRKENGMKKNWHCRRHLPSLREAQPL